MSFSFCVHNLFGSLDFTVNKRKSLTTFSQKVEYWGGLFILGSQQLSLPQAPVRDPYGASQFRLFLSSSGQDSSSSSLELDE